MTDTVLLVGATGMLGSRIAHHLLALPDVRVRKLVRDPAENGRVVETFVRAGAELIEGDLSHPPSLDRATRDVDVVISAVQGGPEVIVDGQVALAKAGRVNGVRRILPSDYALDLCKATPGEHPAFDMRAEADRRIAGIGLEQVNILPGAFMEMLLPGRGTIDLDAGTVSFYGDGNAKIEVTSVEDTAWMIARVVLDRRVPPGKFAFAGDRVSYREAGSTVARVTGRPIKPVSLGTEADLRAAMAKADPQKRVMLAYSLYMNNGQASLSDLQNERYPDFGFERFDAFVERNLKATA